MLPLHRTKRKPCMCGSIEVRAVHAHHIRGRGLRATLERQLSSSFWRRANLHTWLVRLPMPAVPTRSNSIHSNSPAWPRKKKIDNAAKITHRFSAFFFFCEPEMDTKERKRIKPSVSSRVFASKTAGVLQSYIFNLSSLTEVWFPSSEQLCIDLNGNFF